MYVNIYIYISKKNTWIMCFSKKNNSNDDNKFKNRSLKFNGNFREHAIHSEKKNKSYNEKKE